MLGAPEVGAMSCMCSIVVPSKIIPPTKGLVATLPITALEHKLVGVCLDVNRTDLFLCRDICSGRDCCMCCIRESGMERAISVYSILELEGNIFPEPW